MSELIPANSLGFMLTDTSRLFHQTLEREVDVSGIGLTPGEIRALSYVVHYDGSRQNVLAEHMGIDPMTLSSYMDRLEARGLVTRVTGPPDRRVKVVRKTAKAQKTLDNLRPLALNVYDMAIKGLSATEVRTLETALSTIRVNLSQELSLNSSCRSSGGESDGALGSQLRTTRRR